MIFFADKHSNYLNCEISLTPLTINHWSQDDCILPLTCWTITLQREKRQEEARAMRSPSMGTFPAHLLAMAGTVTR